MKLSSPTTFVVQAKAKKHLETVPTRAMVNLDAARHGKLGPSGQIGCWPLKEESCLRCLQEFWPINAAA